MLTGEASESPDLIHEDDAASPSAESDLISTPNQPRCQNFPAKQFGKQKHTFNSKWFDNDKWSSDGFTGMRALIKRLAIFVRISVI